MTRRESFATAILFSVFLAATVSAGDRVILTDYGLGSPEEMGIFVERLGQNGLRVEYRTAARQSFSPLLDEDARACDMAIAVIGRSREMREGEIETYASLAQRGGCLVLLGAQTIPGESDNDLFLFNSILARVGAPMRFEGGAFRDAGHHLGTAWRSVVRARKGTPLAAGGLDTFLGGGPASLAVAAGCWVPVTDFSEREAALMAVAKIGDSIVVAADWQLVRGYSHDPANNPLASKNATFCENFARFLAEACRGRIEVPNDNPIGPVVTLPSPRPPEKPLNRGGMTRPRLPDIPVRPVGESAGVEVFVTDSMQRVFPSSPLAVDKSALRFAELSAAKGEAESFQLVLRPLRDTELLVESASARFTGFSRRLPSSSVHVRRVGLLNSIFPDVLADTFPVALKPQECRALWVDVTVPFNARPGTYRGVVGLRFTNGGNLQVPFRLKVWDFAIPGDKHFNHALFSAYPSQVGKAMGPTPPAYRSSEWIAFVEREFREKMVVRRIMPDSVLARGIRDYAVDDVHGKEDRPLEEMIGGDFQKNFLDAARSYVTLGFPTVGKFGNYVHDIRVSRGEARSIEPMRRFWQHWAALLRAEGLDRRVYVQAADENMNEDGIRLFAREMRQVAPSIPIFCTFLGPDAKFLDGVEGAFDIAAFTPDQYFRSGNREWFLKRKGAQSAPRCWWYIHDHVGSPKTHGSVPRLFHWAAWKEGVDGCCLWCVNQWQDETLRPSADGDVTCSAVHSSLFWPGVGRTFVSPNLEHVRDGLEDYEYFWLLDRAVREERLVGPDLREARDLLAVPIQIVAGPDKISLDSAAILKTRERMAFLIERAGNPTSVLNR